MMSATFQFFMLNSKTPTCENSLDFFPTDEERTGRRLAYVLPDVHHNFLVQLLEVVDFVKITQLRPPPHECSQRVPYIFRESNVLNLLVGVEYGEHGGLGPSLYRRNDAALVVDVRYKRDVVQ